MDSNPQLNSCAEVAPLLVFYACDEVEQHEREQIDAHLAKCEACRSLLGEESELQTAVSSVSQLADEIDPTGALLAQCRSELSEKLDDLEMPKVREHWMPFGWVQRWMALRPAWSAAGLIVFGVAIGTQLVPWLAVRERRQRSQYGPGGKRDGDAAIDRRTAFQNGGGGNHVCARAGCGSRNVAGAGEDGAAADGCRQRG